MKKFLRNFSADVRGMAGGVFFTSVYACRCLHGAHGSPQVEKSNTYILIY